ncbi:MAG: S-adenosyl-l-methionine hydroxide adenosyltransferase family protein [Thermaurantimonas sp.]|uniref:SAM hydrolase/SAM-dependent halogenase family protein n=1 Tax=Thermaurantimonas sp. TaxID=2681568 RepID=UPI00391B857B
MPLITLTSDYGLRDHYVGALKALIYKYHETATIIDISHQISTFKVSEAAAVLLFARQYFPENSVHIVCVDENPVSEAASGRILAGYVEGQYYITADNSFLGYINFHKTAAKVVEIPIDANDRSSWRAHTIAKAAAALAKEIDLSQIGYEPGEYLSNGFPQPFFRNNDTQLIAQVIFIDEYGNIVTNVHKRYFEKNFQRLSFEIKIRNNVIRRIVAGYEELKFRNTGEAFALFNSAGFLEIGLINSANVHQPRGYARSLGADKLLGVKTGDTITIEFV